MSDAEIRDEPTEGDDVQEDTQSRRKLLKGAAALAAAAAGGGIVASGAEAQREIIRPGLQRGGLQQINLSEVTRPIQAIRQVRPELGDVGPLLNDINAYIQPILDKGGLVSWGVTAIDSNVSVSSTMGPAMGLEQR